MSFHRRPLLRAGGLLALAGFAGCLATGDETTRSTASPTSEVGTGTDEWRTAVRPADRLVLQATSAVTLTVRYSGSQATETDPVSYSLDAEETVHATEFTEGRVAVSAGDRTVWGGWVGPAYHIVLTVDGDGELVNAAVTAV